MCSFFFFFFDNSILLCMSCHEAQRSGRGKFLKGIIPCPTRGTYYIVRQCHLISEALNNVQSLKSIQPRVNASIHNVSGA